MPQNHWSTRLPFYYGWIVVAVAFTTMAIGVNARTAFSLLYPAILDEYGWDRGATAGIFAFGFLASMLITPFVGTLMERFGPQRVIPVGALTVALGLGLTPLVDSLWALYFSLGALTVGGSVAVSYIGHASFLPNWFVARRGLVLGITFSGVGVGGIVLFPLLQTFIESVGWREACVGLAVLIVITIVPLNAFAQRRKPQDLGLLADGATEDLNNPAVTADFVADKQFASIEWTYARIVREPRFWAVVFAYLFSLFNHYAVQVHQTKFFIEAGFSVSESAWALGFMVLIGIPGQIAIGWISDRIGREWGWTLSMLGYVICFITFLCMQTDALHWQLYLCIAAVGLLGAGTAPLFGAIGAEMFAGRWYGRVFGLLGAACSVGAAAGAWLTGVMYDVTGSYAFGFKLCIAFAILSALCITLAGPGRIRPVTGRRPRAARW